MAAQYKTKCPHCGAQFRIGEEHLKQASGNVRCGSCLKVFQAMDHLVQEAPAKKPAAKAAPVKPAKPAQPAPSGESQAAPPEKWTLPGQAEEKDS
ncbi:MAG: MJ0042-type zinc finger domain-containing protein, partial [Alcanivoracaceae bacterium]